jgi:hypothetical protein
VSLRGRYISTPGTKSKIGSLILSMFLCANTHHNLEVPYKELAAKSGL